MNKKVIWICLAIFVAILILSIICIIVLKKDETEVIEKTNSKVEQSKTEDKELFEEYYGEANDKIKTLSLDEKIGQIFLSRYPGENAMDILKQYKFGGYLLFEKDFRDKTEEEVKIEIEELQKVANIPLLIAVDEEGGNIVRVSSNPNLVSEKFKSPNELYNLGGFDKIREDTIEKSNILYNLGINLNLAPVVDVTNNTEDYIYQRTLGKDTNLTCSYAETVISASKQGKVSYTLKHFPGYGSNQDTHKVESVDNKTYEGILQYDIPPFSAGIAAGAEAVLVSHNVVTSIDPDNPASLSLNMHKLLRENLGFSGVIITDDLYMGAVAADEDAVIKSILAGNDLIIVTDYAKSVEDVKRALEEGRIEEKAIDDMASKIIAWKYYKGLIEE